MPTRKADKTPVENTNSTWKGFVNVPLTDADWNTIDNALKDKKLVEGVPGHLDYLLELGKVTFNYSNGSISCSLTILEGAQQGYTVSSFSDSLIEALLTTRYKVQTYLPEFDNLFKNGAPRKRRG